MKIKTLLICAYLQLFAISNYYSQTNCMNIGVGLSGSSYWDNGENPFLDQMKYAGNWISFAASGPSAWDTYHSSEFLYDINGYASGGIPYLTSGGREKLRQVISADGRVSLQQYVFLYDGFGVFTFNGFTVNSTSPGRIVLTCNTTGNAWLNIDSSSIAPNHARNFRMVPIANEFNYQSNLFRPQFLDKATNFSAFRFMDWFHTNNSPLNVWTDRSTPNYYSQSTSKGVAYEYAIKLCNQTNKQPWVCVPHLADTNYIIRMAQLFRDSLNPSLDIYLEYSNEVWNFQFQQTQWLNNSGLYYPLTWPPNTLYNASESFAYNSGLLANRVFTLWRQEFGADSLRVKRVLGSQAVNSWVGQENILATNHHYDYLSPSWYFGISPSDASAYTAATTPLEIIDSCRQFFYTEAMPGIKGHIALAALDNKEVIYYEGGQHISAYGNSANPALLAMYDAQVAPEMYTLYDNVLDSLRGWGSALAMAFTLGGSNSVYGSWGHIPCVDSASSLSYSPKYQVLIDNLPSTIPGCSPLSSSTQSYKENEVHAYPNPFTNKITIAFDDLQQNTEIRIVDIYGKEVKKIKFSGKELIIERENLSVGLYLLFCTDKNKTVKTKKIIIQ